jgi:Coenzyme PQQ synthesis protein D (PqqD)
MKYRLTSAQISTTIGDEVVILDHKKGIYYTLDNVGTVVWEKIKEVDSSFDEILEHVVSLYEINHETCAADIKALLNELTDIKVVEEVPA